jgi:hypothetical protein
MSIHVFGQEYTNLKIIVFIFYEKYRTISNINLFLIVNTLLITLAKIKKELKASKPLNLTRIGVPLKIRQKLNSPQVLRLKHLNK